MVTSHHQIFLSEALKDGLPSSIMWLLLLLCGARSFEDHVVELGSRPLLLLLLLLLLSILISMFGGESFAWTAGTLKTLTSFDGGDAFPLFPVVTFVKP